MSDTAIIEPWYATEKRGEALISVFKALLEDEASRFADYRRWQALYAGQNPESVTAGTWNSLRSPSSTEGRSEKLRVDDFLPVNDAANMVDTMVSWQTSKPVLPWHQVDDADYGTRRKAVRLDQFIGGVMMAANYDEVQRDAFRFGCICGTGVIKVIGQPKNLTPTLESVFPWEVLVDPLEARYGTPRSYYQWRVVDRAVAAATWPSRREKIMGAARVSETDGELSTVPLPFRLGRTDSIMVVEGWHLPSIGGAKDGRHVIALTTGATLADEKWDRDTPPLAFIRFRKHPSSFWGIGIPEGTYSVLSTTAGIMKSIADAIKLMARPRWLVKAGTLVKKDSITNEIATIIEYTGDTPPVPVSPAGMSQDVYFWCEKLRGFAYDSQGISALAARMEKPAGLNSGRALAIFTDVQQGRHFEAGKSVERLSIVVAGLIEEEVRQQAAEVGADQITIRSPIKGAGSWRKLTWADVELPKDSYTIQVYPVSALANSPAMRAEQLDELVKLGAVPSEMVPELMGMFDTDAWNRRQYIDRELAEWQVEQVLEGKWSPPETAENVDLPFQNLDIAIEVYRTAYLLATMEHAPVERLEGLRRLLEEARLWKKRAMDEAQRQAMEQAQVAAMAGGPPAPGAGPDATGADDVLAPGEGPPTDPSALMEPEAGAAPGEGAPA